MINEAGGSARRGGRGDPARAAGRGAADGAARRGRAERGGGAGRPGSRAAGEISSRRRDEVGAAAYGDGVTDSGPIVRPMLIISEVGPMPRIVADDVTLSAVAPVCRP